METLAKTDFITTELQKFETEFEINETGLVALRDAFKELKIEGQEDKAGLKVVETARKALKSQRVKIKKASESLRESAVRFQKAVIEREKSLISLIEPTEKTLASLEEGYYEEKERLRLEEEKKESDRIQAMIDKLDAVNHAIDFHELKGLTDEQFDAVLKEATEKYEETARQMAIELEQEKQRQAEIEEERKKEEARLAKEREDYAERQRKFEQEQAYFREEQKRIEQFNAKVAEDLKAAQDKLDAEKKSIEDQKEAERLRIQREKELEEAKKKAAEDARIEAEATAKRIQEEKIEAERLAKEQEEEKLLAGDDSGRFTALRTLLTTNLLGDNVVIWTHFKSKKGKAAAVKVHALVSEARQICMDNIK